MHIHPPRRQRQTHQNTLDARAGRIQAETGAAIVHEIELDVATAAELLPLLLALGEGHEHALAHDGQIGGQEGRQAVLHEGEELFLVFFGFVEVVEEDAADAAGFVAVLDVEIVVAPLFEARVVGAVVFVAGVFDGAVEVDGVFVEEVAGR